MTEARSIAGVVAMLMLVVASVTKDAWYSDGLRYVALTYMIGDFLWRIYAGYRRRRPHWTADSWRRYLLACTVPLGAFAMMIAIAVAIDMKLPFVGASRTALRAAWVSGILLGLLVGGVGLSVVVGWLNEGEPSRQFSLPRWLTWRPRSSAQSGE